MKTVHPAQFLDSYGRRVLTHDGKPGRDGIEGLGSATEQMQGEIANLLYSYASRFNRQQLRELQSWIALYDDAQQ